jgi:hypothetical protein
VENHRENGLPAAGRVSGATFVVGRGLWGCGIASDPESPVVSGQWSVLKKPVTDHWRLTTDISAWKTGRFLGNSPVASSWSATIREFS